MKTLPLVLALLILAPSSNSLAHGRQRGCVFNSSCCNSPARWGARHDTGDARLAITTRDGDATLLLTGEVVAVQLSDRAFHKVNRKLRNEMEDADDNALGHVIKTAVLSGVRAVLDHSAECSIRKVRDVEYVDGRLEFTTERGRRLFGHLDVNDQDVMAGFSESDAQAFVREFRKAKADTR